MSKILPEFVSEAELDRRFQTAALLKSAGDYGCGCVVFDGDLGDEPHLFSDEWFHALNARHPNDVGTVLITGTVRAEAELFVSDRLMCLVILGSLEASGLSVFETETFVGGDLRVGALSDRDEYLTVRGARHVAATSG